MPLDDIDYRPDRAPLVGPGQIECHDRDMTVTASADVAMRDLQRRLADLDQWLPVDGDPDLHLRDLVQRNTTGPLRLGFGHWRDLLLGCQFTNGLGQLVTAGGRTVKNVAGYDLAKLIVGQHGILGRLVTITTRTYRRPEAALLATLPPDPAILGRLLPAPARPQWTALTADALLCGYLADHRTIDFYRASLPATWPDLADLAERSPEDDDAHRARLWAPAGAPRSFRATVPPARVPEFVRSAFPTGAAGAWCADPTFGIVIGLTDIGMGTQADRRAALARAATSVGGRVYFLGPGPDPQPEGLIITDAERNLLTRLKEAFDPTGTLPPLPS